MLRQRFILICGLLVSGQVGLGAEDPVFSGPQVGEKLPSFTAQGVAGTLEGSSFDFVTQANGNPTLLIFFHELTRPGFGLMRTITKFAATKSDKGLQAGVIFLTDDATATSKWAQNVRQHFSEGVTYGLSPDGKEGPGSYGLNRNVTLTILVAKEGKVTANFALVQPQLQADGPRILEAIAEVTGGGKVPSIADLAGERDGARRRQMEKNSAAPGAMNRADGARGGPDAKLASLLRAVINKRATDDEVANAATEVEKYVANNDAASKELARIVTTVVGSGKIGNYGTEAAQRVLRGWLSKYGDKDSTSPVE